MECLTPPVHPTSLSFPITEKSLQTTSLSEKKRQRQRQKRQSIPTTSFSPLQQANVMTLKPTQVKQNKSNTTIMFSMSEEEDYGEPTLECANGQVRRMRSILDMRLGALVAAKIPLEDGHVNSIRSFSPKRNRCNIRNEDRNVYCDNSNVLRLQQQLELNGDGNLKHTISCQNFFEEGIKEGSNVQLNCRELHTSNRNHCDDDDDDDDSIFDIFGIPIPSKTSKSNPEFNFNNNSKTSSIPLDISVLSASPLTLPNYPILHAESPSRLDLSALLC